MKTKSTGRKILNPHAIKSRRSVVEPKEQGALASIVVPIDFSETSLTALDYALALAAEFGSRIHLVHVLEFPKVFNATSKPSYVIWDNEIKRTATARLAKLVEQKIGEFISATSEVRFGRAYNAVCETARKQKADLIVMGTHGFTGLKHVLLGSTAERVVRYAPCSVLVIRKQTSHNVQSFLRLKNILVPTDFSEPAHQALESTVALARQYQSKVHLLYVVPAHYAVGDYDVIDYAMLSADEKKAGEEKIATLSEELLSKGISVATKISQGRPAVEINNAAAELECDLIVISTHGHTGWERMTLGSTTEEVVRHSSCPVLVSRNAASLKGSTNEFF